MIWCMDCVIYKVCCCLGYGLVKYWNEGEREVYVFICVVEKWIVDCVCIRGCGQEWYGGWFVENVFGDSDGEGWGLLSCFGGWRLVFWGR